MLKPIINIYNQNHLFYYSIDIFILYIAIYKERNEKKGGFISRIFFVFISNNSFYPYSISYPICYSLDIVNEFWK